MSIEYIKYYVQMSGFHLITPIEKNYKNSLIKKVIIENDFITIDKIVTFYFDEIEEIELAKKVADEELNHLLNKIAFVANSYTSNPIVVNYKEKHCDRHKKINNNYEIDITLNYPCLKARDS